MGTRRLRAQEWAAGALGAILLGSTFLDWYGAGTVRRDAWESFGALDLLLAVVGLMALALAIVAAAHRTQAVPVAIGSLLVLLSVVASVWLVVRTASPPELRGGVGTTRESGVWVGLAACLGLTGMAIASIRDERFPSAVRRTSRVEAPVHRAPPPEETGQAGS